MTAKKDKKADAKLPADNGERGAMDTSKLGASAPVDAGAEASAPVDAKPVKAEKDSTTFVFKNGGSRSFSKSVHGSKWEDLADEFAGTNAKILASRDGKELA